MTCKCDDVKQGPFRIFDSRKAKGLYQEYQYARSGTFKVPPGYIALIELIAPVGYYEQMTFTAVRLPSTVTGPDGECYPDCGIGKRYRRWKCTQSLGKDESINDQPSQLTPYKASIVRWGWDDYREEIVEFEYIVRPGSYYISADRCAEVLDNCINPTIIEMSLIKVDNIPDLALPCAFYEGTCC